ncbi:uncharacterized protein LOC6576033 [Drosophila mojavensis]|uniref:Uncharacterized protein n=1 Tax=Drosophila mojavensis TaxID=7230 RepID=B4KJN3_DROMO|nr:uncharacterized protein LOC6576033 [Drosophila mojavensis]EDW11478.1 uncharacterized protein Dmoj_GI14231 [Drosophila mojavensis]
MQYLYVISALILAIAVQQGVAIKCFVCNSHKDANCALDIPPDNLLKDCQEDYSSRDRGIPTYCRKITQIIEFSVNSLPPDSRVIRTCGFQNQTSTNYCYQRAGFGGRQVVCSCDTDNCNGSASLSGISGLGLLATVGLLLGVCKWLQR